MGQTVHYGQDVETLADEIKDLLKSKDATLVVTTSMHGTLMAPSKKTQLLRVPMCYASDCLKQENGIPPGAIFIGVMILPKLAASEAMMAGFEIELEEAGGAK